MSSIGVVEFTAIPAVLSVCGVDSVLMVLLTEGCV